MKKIFTIMAAALIGMASLTSCQEDLTKADPVVRYIRPCDPAMGDMLLMEVSMGSTVAIVGEGLGDVCKIWFNDCEAQLNPTLITPTSIIVTVPSNMPTEFTNVMTLETSTGKRTEYPVSVIMPSPSIEWIECLYATEGSELKIHGNYFFPIEETGTVNVTFPGNLPAEVKSVTSELITCIVPAGASETSGSLTIESEFGRTRTTQIWRTTEGMFETFENEDNLPWSKANLQSEGGCSGSYHYIHSTFDPGQWPYIDLIWDNPEGIALITEGEASEYAFSFEFCGTEMGGYAIKMGFQKEWGSDGIGSDFRGLTGGYYFFDPGEGEYEDGRWYTVTVPLEDFCRNADNNDDVAPISKIGEMVNFTAVTYCYGEDGGVVDLKFDNFRIVRIN